MAVTGRHVTLSDEIKAAVGLCLGFLLKKSGREGKRVFALDPRSSWTASTRLFTSLHAAAFEDLIRHCVGKPRHSRVRRGYDDITFTSISSCKGSEY